MQQLSIVPESAVRAVLTRELAFSAVQEALEAVANDSVQLFDVLVARGVDHQDSYAIKAATDSRRDIVGFKVGSYWPRNVERQLQAHAATTLLLDPDTGYPQVLVNATLLNGYRTAAANAVATDCLARPESTVLGVIGAGHQAVHEIRALARIRALQLIKVATRSRARGEWLQGELRDLDIELRLTDIQEAVRDADIVTTVTPAREALVNSDWVAPGTHISAMGADAQGKQELEVVLVTGARLFADHPWQSVRIGEFHSVFALGQLTDIKRITPIGLVTQGLAQGRTSEDEITVFDSSGLAAQDIIIAQRVCELAQAAGLLAQCPF